MPNELVHEGYLISDDPARLDVAAVHAYLTGSYWAAHIPLEIVARSLQNSLGLGVYAPKTMPDNPSESQAQVGLARIVSDYTTFAYLCDVYVLPAHRGRGLAKALMRAVQTHPRLQGLRRFNLVTQDAHGLYRQFGFATVAKPERYMEKLDREISQRWLLEAKSTESGGTHEFRNGS